MLARLKRLIFHEKNDETLQKLKDFKTFLNQKIGILTKADLQKVIEDLESLINGGKEQITTETEDELHL